MILDKFKILLKFLYAYPHYIIATFTFSIMLGAILVGVSLLLLNIVSGIYMTFKIFAYMSITASIPISIFGINSYIDDNIQYDYIYNQYFIDKYEKNTKYQNKKNIKKANKLNKQIFNRKEEIENEIKRLSNYLENIKKHKKEPAFKIELKHTEELIKIYKKML